MEKIDLIFEHFSLPANVNFLIKHCKKIGDEICSRSRGQGDIPQFEPANGRVSWHLLNSVAKQVLPVRNPTFCELGCGIGLVTLIASSIGMSATGIEIEEELVDLAQDSSQQFAIPATFINGSIYPKDNPIQLINYKEVDLFFAYPWPNQITQVIELFKHVATQGAILVCYHGGRNFQVLRC